jgi:hypothetical protein
MISTLGLVDTRYRDTAKRVVPNGPILCPPLADLVFHWKQADFIYIDLHGHQDDPRFLFAGDKPVLSAAALGVLQKGRIVFLTSCYLDETDVLTALRGNTVIWGRGQNFGSLERLTGAPLLAMWIRRFLDLGCTPERALTLAKSRVVLSMWRKGDRDALAFALQETGAARG